MLHKQCTARCQSKMKLTHLMQNVDVDLIIRKHDLKYNSTKYSELIDKNKHLKKKYSHLERKAEGFFHKRLLENRESSESIRKTRRFIIDIAAAFLLTVSTVACYQLKEPLKIAAYTHVAESDMFEQSTRLLFLEEAVDMNPSDAELHERLAEKYEDAGDLVGALNEWRILDKHFDYSYPEPKFRMGELNEELGDISAAIENFEKSEDSDAKKKLAPLYNIMAKRLLKRNDWGVAFQYFNKSYDIDQNTDASNGIADLRISWGFGDLQRHTYKSAVTHFLEALKFRPGDAKGLEGLVGAYTRIADDSDGKTADIYYQKILDIEPSNEHAAAQFRAIHMHNASNHKKRGRNRDAIKEYEIVLSRISGDEDALDGLTLLCMSMGKREEKGKKFQDALWAYNKILEHNNDSNAESRIKYIEKRINDAENHLNECREHSRNDKYSQAIRSCKAALELDPKSETGKDAMIKLAYLCYNSSQYNSAKNYASKALKTYSLNADRQCGLRDIKASVYRRQGHYANAVGELQGCTSVDDKYKEGLAYIYFSWTNSMLPDYEQTKDYSYLIRSEEFMRKAYDLEPSNDSYELLYYSLRYATATSRSEKDLCLEHVKRMRKYCDKDICDEVKKAVSYMRADYWSSIF
ncbi:tetratricopeptide repeat protein [candidate division KSB1 bacterium]